MKINTYQKFFLTFLALILVFWAVLFLSDIKEGFYNYLYSFLFGLIPLIGGIIGMRGAQSWGGLKSAVGKALFFISFGIFLWGCGEAIWSYYNFFEGVPAPYPSLADLGFAPSIFFYGLGSIYLAKATGAKFGLRSTGAKIFAYLAPIAIFVFSYYVLVTVARGGVLVPEGESLLKTILDIAYPVGDFIGLAVSVVISGLSFKYLGGRYILDIASILLGLAVMFIADSIFSYTTTAGTYYNANFGDLILTLGVFFLAFGVVGFCNHIKSEKVSVHTVQ
ncbi:MAG TPA: hypothetical protein VLB02_03150 [Candidatus Paceibacterota bacterium]|nr:hypothetical protein [Candidatus Paceibacterota bacterium]